MKQIEKDALMIKKIQLSNNYEWLKPLLKNNQIKSKVVLEEIKKIPSMEIAILLKKLL
jgi:hypothetical protein